MLLALATGGAGYTFLTRSSRGGEIYHLVIKDGVASIRPGSDVLLRGVKIGEVRDIKLDPMTQNPLLTLAIQQDNPPVVLLRNYEYSIRAGSFIGENYVDIRGVYKPGDAAYRPNTESANDTIIAVAPGGITDLTSQATLIGNDFRATLKRFNSTIDALNSGALSPKTQLKLAQALEGVAKLTNQASKSFGPQGIKFGFGDAQTQRSLAITLANTAQATREATLAAQNIGAAGRNASVTMRNLDATFGENRGQLRALLGNLNSTARNVSGLTESLAFVLDKGGFKENSQLMFRSLRRSAENIETGTAGLRALGDPKTQQTLRETLLSVRDATGALRDTAVGVRNALGNPQTQQQLGSALSSLSQTAQSLQGTAQNLNEISAGLKNVVADPQVENNLKQTIANLNGTLAATRSAAERISSLLGAKKRRDDAEKPVSNSDSGANSDTSSTRSNEKTKNNRDGQEIPAGVDFTLRNESNFRGDNAAERVGHTQGDLTFNAKLFNAPFRLGLAGIGEGNKLTLQSGRYFGPNAALRYGVYRSKLGVGAEVHKGRFSLEGNYYDPNHASYNAYAGFRLTPKLEIIAGRENRDGVRSSAIGVRLRQ